MGVRWVRLYTDAVNSPKLMQLPDDCLKFWLKCLCVADEVTGQLEPLEDLAWACRENVDDVQRKIGVLIQKKLIDKSGDSWKMHNWKERQFPSDRSTKRVKKHRAKQTETPNETLHETLHETPMKHEVKRYSNGTEKIREEQIREETLFPSDDGEKEPVAGVSESELHAVEKQIHQRHPAVRRCGVAEIRKNLLAILRKESKAERGAVLRKINDNHAAICATEEWTKEGGQFSKGLDNWLAPTKMRWAEAPDAITPTTRVGNQPHPGLIGDYDFDEEKEIAYRNNYAKLTGKSC